jgi:hypothetical protein
MMFGAFCSRGSLNQMIEFGRIRTKQPNTLG